MTQDRPKLRVQKINSPKDPKIGNFVHSCVDYNFVFVMLSRMRQVSR